ncbi:immunity-related GTPases-like protein, partial [Panaeolus papilionaceus]
FNIAIVGESGMGKSTLLNAVRGLLSGDPGAAVTGFNESTTIIQGYPDPRNSSIIWYDVPGADTPSINGWRYFTQQGLYIFDALVVVFCDRFTQTAGTLISNAESCNIPIFLVRTKADQILRDIQADSDGEVKEEEARGICLRETERMVQENLSKIGVSHRRTYVVSRPGMKAFV